MFESSEGVESMLEEGIIRYESSAYFMKSLNGDSG